MSWQLWYVMVGVVAAITWEAREPEPGPKATGMLMLLVAWPVFLLAGLAINGASIRLSLRTRVEVVRIEELGVPMLDLRVARLRGVA